LAADVSAVLWGLTIGIIAVTVVRPQLRKAARRISSREWQTQPCGGERRPSMAPANALIFVAYLVAACAAYLLPIFLFMAPPMASGITTMLAADWQLGLRHSGAELGYLAYSSALVPFFVILREEVALFDAVTRARKEPPRVLPGPRFMAAWTVFGWAAMVWLVGLAVLR
jgi:hypothetical protein